MLVTAAEQVRLGRGGGDLLGRELIAGTIEHGYYGEYSATEVIGRVALCTMVNLTAGSLTGSDRWFGVSLNGKRLLVAGNVIRRSVTWNNLNALGLIYGKEVSIKDTRFKCRSIKGLADGVTPVSVSGHNDPATHGSEWNRIIYHLVRRGGNDNFSSEGISTGDWESINSATLSINVTGDSARATFCQELTTSGNVVTRGFYSASSVDTTIKTYAAREYGWRPVLELID